MRRANWAILVLGVWTLISPWAAPFLGISVTWNGVFVGVLVIICALWALFGERPPEGPKV